MIRYVAAAIGAVLLIWLTYLCLVTFPKAKAGEPGQRANLFFNGLGLVAVIAFLTFIITSFQQ